MNQLMSFGIPLHALPINVENGDINLQFHHNWMRMIRTLETSSSSSPVPVSLSTNAGGHGSTASITSSNAVDGGGEPMMQQQQFQQEMSSSSRSSSSSSGEVIVVPGPMDIVLGRGNHSRTSQGYLRFRLLLGELFDAYDAADRSEKRSVARQALAEAEKQGCRFLKEVKTEHNDNSEEAGPPILLACDVDEKLDKVRAHIMKFSWRIKIR